MRKFLCLLFLCLIANPLFADEIEKRSIESITRYKFAGDSMPDGAAFRVFANGAAANESSMRYMPMTYGASEEELRVLLAAVAESRSLADQELAEIEYRVGCLMDAGDVTPEVAFKAFDAFDDLRWRVYSKYYILTKVSLSEKHGDLLDKILESVRRTSRYIVTDAKKSWGEDYGYLAVERLLEICAGATEEVR